MLTASKLEKIMELETNLKAQYQEQLDARTNELESAIREKESLQATIAKQLETISELSEKATANQRVEQLNRELTNRSDKLQAEASDLKKRTKGLQKELVQARDELKILKQYDPLRMKKNLDANKKKLAENKTANDLLQKAVNKAKMEKMELQQKVDELEARLAALDDTQETAADAPQTEAAAA